MSEIEEMTEAQTAWVDWTMAQSGVATPGCSCGHDGMGVSWHASTCPGAITALAHKAAQVRAAEKRAT